jgi:hypothetical protein
MSNAIENQKSSNQKKMSEESIERSLMRGMLPFIWGALFWLTWFAYFYTGDNSWEPLATKIQQGQWETKWLYLPAALIITLLGSIFGGLPSKSEFAATAITLVFVISTGVANALLEPEERWRGQFIPRKCSVCGTEERVVKIESSENSEPVCLRCLIFKKTYPQASKTFNFRIGAKTVLAIAAPTGSYLVGDNAPQVHGEGFTVVNAKEVRWPLFLLEWLVRRSADSFYSVAVIGKGAMKSFRICFADLASLTGSGLKSDNIPIFVPAICTAYHQVISLFPKDAVREAMYHEKVWASCQDQIQQGKPAAFL